MLCTVLFDMCFEVKEEADGDASGKCKTKLLVQRFPECCKNFQKSFLNAVPSVGFFPRPMLRVIYRGFR